MPRPKRKKIEFTESSLNELLQEIYDDTHNIKAKISRLFNKWEIKVKDNGEIAAIGEQIIKLINLEAKNQDQKITLLKYLKDVVYKDGIKTKDDDEKEELSANDRSDLLRMVREEMKANGH